MKGKRIAAMETKFRQLPRACNLLIAWTVVTVAATASAPAAPSAAPRLSSPSRHCGFCLSPITIDRRAEQDFQKLEDSADRRDCESSLGNTRQGGADLSSSSSSFTARRCGKCSRRMYCSEGCIVEDSRNEEGVGQVHGSWCGLEYGEEDIDWEVREISPEKGLGVVALRRFRDGERVMIERGLTIEQVLSGQHPAVENLEPRGGDLQDKFELNAVGVPDDGEDRLGVRVSRCNHGCDYNVQYWWTPPSRDGACTMVLVASREIQVGEEIVTAYVSYDNCWHDTSAEACRLELSSEWGIVCPSDCLCYDQARNRLIARYRDLFKSFQNKCDSSPSEALAVFDDMMELMRELKFGVCARAHQYLGAAMAAAQHQDTRPRVREYLELYQEGEVKKFGKRDQSADAWWRQAQSLPA